MSTLEIKITQDVDLGRLAGLLCCAFEGGTNYWAKIEMVPGDAKPDVESFGPDWKDIADYRHLWCPLTEGAKVKVWDTESPDDLLGELTLEKVKAALPAFLKTAHGRNFVQEEDDAETGDVFVQYCLFGEIVYG
jgi:hypothetical protein